MRSSGWSRCRVVGRRGPRSAGVAAGQGHGLRGVFHALPIEAVLSVVAGAVLSMRICVPAVLTASVLPAASTEKYLIVYVPAAVSEIDVPWVDPVVGVVPLVV